MADPFTSERRGIPAPPPSLLSDIAGELHRLLACLGFGLAAALILMLSGALK